MDGRGAIRRRCGVLVVAAAVLVFAGGALAVAVPGAAPRVDPVLATFSFASAYERQRICVGEDGPYVEIRAQHEGAQTGDPRLSGAMELEAHNVVNLVTGLGTSEGTYTIRDPATNRLKVSGRYYGVFTEGSKFHGLAVASVKEGGRESRQIGLFEADVDLTTGVVSGQLGGVAADARTPAVVARGTCTGPWTRVESP